MYPELGYELEQLWDWCKDHDVYLTITTSFGGGIVGERDDQRWTYSLGGAPISARTLRAAQQLLTRSFPES